MPNRQATGVDSRVITRYFYAATCASLRLPEEARCPGSVLEEPNPLIAHQGSDAEVLTTRSGAYRPQRLNPLGCHQQRPVVGRRGGALLGDS